MSIKTNYLGNRSLLLYTDTDRIIYLKIFRVYDPVLTE